MPKSKSPVPVASSLRHKVASEVRSLDLSKYDDWVDIQDFAREIEQDKIEVADDEVTIEDDKVYGPMNVYVNLKQDFSDSSLNTTEGFPGKFFGHIDRDNKVVIDRIDIDLSSFYE